jgi:hypothetical protein
MKVRLFDILDLKRPLASAARDFDWTEVVNLFPEATNEGMTAARVWVLASMIVLGDVMGLSEGEILTRWPENPYWQAFSGYEHFQWETPVTETDCHAFRRYLDAARSARLASIAKLIRDSKPLERKLTSPVEANMDSSGDAALALRKLHFIQPQTVSVYKAPTRPDFHSSVKQAYAKAATILKKVEPESVPEPAPTAPKENAADLPASEQAPAATAKKDGANDAQPGKDSAKVALPKNADAKGAPAQKPDEPQKTEAEATPPDPSEIAPETGTSEFISIQSKPESFTQTYSALARRMPIPLPVSPVLEAPPKTEAPAAQASAPLAASIYPPSPSTSSPSNPFGSNPEPAFVPSPAQIQAMFRTTVAKPKEEAPNSKASPFAVQIQDSSKKQAPVAPAGCPRFDDSTPKVIRAAAGEPIKMEVIVSGDEPLKYQWEQWDDIKGISLPIEGCTEPSLTIAMEPDDTMLAFQCRVSNQAAPEGVVSRTFFAKKVTNSQKDQNSFGEKFDPKLFNSGRV